MCSCHVHLRSLRFSMMKLVQNGPNNGERKMAAGGKKVEGARKNGRVLFRPLFTLDSIPKSAVKFLLPVC